MMLALLGSQVVLGDLKTEHEGVFFLRWSPPTCSAVCDTRWNEIIAPVWNLMARQEVLSAAHIIPKSLYSPVTEGSAPQPYIVPISLYLYSPI